MSKPDPGEPGYRIFLRSRSPRGPDPIGGIGSLEQEDPSAAGGWRTRNTLQWTVSPGATYDVGLLNLPGTASDRFDLKDKKTYRLTLRHRSGHRFPEIDMIAVTQRRFPTNKDLCC